MADRRVAEASSCDRGHVLHDRGVRIDFAGADERPAEQGRDRLGDAEHLVVANTGCQPLERDGVALDRHERVRFRRGQVLPQHALALRAVERQVEQVACRFEAEGARVEAMADARGGDQFARVPKRPARVGWLHPVGERGTIHAGSMATRRRACRTLSRST